MASENYKLIYYVINKIRTNVEFEELESVALVGYAKALNAFDNDKGVKFSTYAIRCMHNEICCFLSKENKKTSNETSLFKSYVSDDDKSDAYISEILGDSSTEIEDLYIEQEDLKEAVEFISKLSKRDQFIILHRFGILGKEKKTQSEIADTLKTTQANISKIEKRILKDLRKKMSIS